MDSTDALILPPTPSNAASNSVSGAAEALDIRGIKGPVEIPSLYGWLWWVLIALAAAAVAWFLWRAYQRRKAAPAPRVIIPPHRKAKDRLRAAAGLISDPYAFCSLVSDVVRAYIEDRFELRAPERTTEEFLNELRGTDRLRLDHKELLEEFLSRCDLVKFARFEPTAPELQSRLDAALQFIDETALAAVDEIPGKEEEKTT